MPSHLDLSGLIEYFLRNSRERIYSSWRLLLLRCDLSCLPRMPQDGNDCVFGLAVGGQQVSELASVFPHEFGWNSRSVVRRMLEQRAAAQVPCFTARDAQSQMILAAVWCPPHLLAPVGQEEGTAQPRSLEISNLFVVPSARSRHLARNLLLFALEQMAACGYTVAHSYIFPARTASVRSHLGAGFTIIGAVHSGSVIGIPFRRFTSRIGNARGTYPSTPAIIVGEDGANTLAVARALGRKGIPVAVLSSSPAEMVRRCRYVRSVGSFAYGTGGKSLEKAIQQLVAADWQGIKPLLFWTNEDTLYELSQNEEAICQYAKAIMPIGRAAAFIPKSSQAAIAREAGFSVPQTTVLDSPEALERALGLMAFPIMVKPDHHRTRGTFAHKVVLCRSAQELSEIVYPTLTAQTRLIAQEFVEGGDDAVAFFMASCDDSGHVRHCVSGHKIRQWPIGQGVMASGTTASCPEFEAKCQTMCRLLGVSGLIGIEAKMCARTGAWYYIEVSLRSESFVGIAEKAGVNVVFDAYLHAMGYPPLTVGRSRKATWVDCESDLDAAKATDTRGAIALLKHLRLYGGPVAFSIYAGDDPLPFVHRALARVRARLTRRRQVRES